MIFDYWIATLLRPLAFWILLNGIDDLFVGIVGLLSWFLQRFSSKPRHRTPSEREFDSIPARPMAVFVALWQEHRVIQKMIDNNVTKLHCPHCDFFVGVYPNDLPTIAAAGAVMERYPNVHISRLPARWTHLQSRQS